MKKFAILLTLFGICFSSFSYSQHYDESVCPLPESNPRSDYSQTGGKYKPASNLPGQYLRVLVVLAYFGEGGSYPDWADDFIDTQSGSSYRDMTVSDYWDEMSLGNFDVIGDVYPELVVLPPVSWYQQNNLHWYDANIDILEAIDPDVNFNLYDNWRLSNGQFIFSPGNSDRLVDMIYVIYCNPDADTRVWIGWSGISMLGFSPEFVTNDLNSLGQTIKVNGGLGSSGSGLTIRTGLPMVIISSKLVTERIENDFGTLH